MTVSASRRQALGLILASPLVAAAPASAFSGLVGPATPIPVPGFADLAPIALPAGEVVIAVDPGSSDVRDPFTLRQVAESWARQRFGAGGGGGTARVVLFPSVRKEVFYRGFNDRLGERREDTFRARLGVRIEGPGGQLLAQSQADERIIVLGDALTSDRRVRLAKLLERVTRELDGQVVGVL